LHILGWVPNHSTIVLYRCMMDEHNSTSTSEEEYAASESDSEGEESIGSSISSAPSNRRRRNHERVTWEDRYQDLKAFIEEHDGAFPKRRTSLGTWISDQRKPSKLNALSTEKIRLLEKLNVFQSRLEQKWSFMFSLLREYQLEHGHTKVLVRDTYKGERLGKWVSCQRVLYANETLSSHREDKLKSINFEWVCREGGAPAAFKWEQSYAALVDYKAKHGHSRISHPIRDADTKKLATWVKNQQKRLPSLAATGDPVCVERKRRLDDIDFPWAVADSGKWDVMFAGLNRFHKEHGHCRVHRRYEDKLLPANLGHWVLTQRRTVLEKIKEGDEQAVERKECLDELGFVWQTGYEQTQCKDNVNDNGKRESANDAAEKVGSEVQSKRSRPVLQRTAKLPPSDNRNGGMVEFLQCDGLGDSGRDRRRQRDGTKPQSFPPGERTEDHVERDLPTFDQRREKNDTAAVITNEKENNLQMTSPCPQKRRKKQNWRNFPLAP